MREVRRFAEGRVRAAVLFLLVFLLLSLSAVRQKVSAEEIQEQPPQQQEDMDQAAERVKTIRWKAKLTANIRVNLGGQKVKIKAGKSVVIINRRYSVNGKTRKSVALIKGHRVSIPNKFLFYVKDLCTITTEGDYPRSVKEAWVNKKVFRSKTPWLVWISLDKQRVNVFTGPKKGGEWTLIKTFPCSTGKAETPTTPHQNPQCDISFKALKYKYFKNNGFLYYFTEVSGSGMHKWIGGNRGRLLGKHTASNGCIRMKEKHAKWVFDNVPILTRAVVW